MNNEIFRINKLYDCIEDAINKGKVNRKMLICIPSYNINKKKNTIHYLNSSKYSDYFDIHVFVRDSQEKEYLELFKMYSNVSIHSNSDEKICNTGLVRNWIMNYISNNLMNNLTNEYNLDKIFMFDDDLFKFTMFGEKNIDPYVLMYVWYDIATLTGSVITSGMNCQSGRINDRAEKDSASFKDLIKINSSWGFGFSTINIPDLIESNITYRDSSLIGHEDIDIMASLLKLGFTYSKFNFIYPHFNSYDSSRWNDMDRKSRHEIQRDLMMNSDNSDIYKERGINVQFDWNKINSKYFVNIDSIRDESYKKINQYINLF